MTVFSTNPGYDSCEQQTTHQWVERVFAGGATCLLEQESLCLEEEIGEGAFGKVYRGPFCILFALQNLIIMSELKFTLCTSLTLK